MFGKDRSEIKQIDQKRLEYLLSTTYTADKLIMVAPVTIKSIEVRLVYSNT